MQHAPAAGEITELLERWRGGDRGALDRLFALAHGELVKIARARLGSRSDTLFSPTVLVNEACLKLLSREPGTDRPWRSRGQFYALVSTAMLHILVDHAKRKKAAKHGGDTVWVSFDPERDGRPSPDLLALGQALAGLERLDRRQANIWKCRFLCGLKIAEMAEAFELGESTIRRELKAANGWVRSQLRHSGGNLAMT
ncbi:ECF sigma factor [Sulfidibacter corallicola]|uniref:RNA polymerase sigma-70 ECF-like HTH domain-containing protein n=1 Tax=Sulfidibacter corallicola TaxID=2818388 RepID=A0A8A4TI64_SULCO|nr:ECF-type sigma factor [Sulfidibacter corallicola]QTD49313.1 hypothetical protein J3U87_27320 [Sulfidibacter corallicola]